MGVEYLIADGVLNMTFEGVYQPVDVVNRFVEAMSDPDCPRPVALLIDVSRSESLATRPAMDIRSVAEFLGPYADRIGGRCAVVAPSDVHFGLSQMGSVHSERVGVTSQVFRTRGDALAWLRSPMTRGPS
jgi:hypothetical protein